MTGRLLRLLTSLPVARLDALLLEVLAQFLRIHVVGALVDVDELRQRAGLRNRFRRRDKGIRNSDGHIPWLHACRHQGEAQARRCRCPHRLQCCASQKVAKSFSKSSTIGPPMKPAVPKCLLEDCRRAPAQVPRAA